MSNKRLKRTEVEFFVYEPGVVVPRDVTRLLVPPGVEVLPAEVFRGLVHLKEVVLSEGLREIGHGALAGCMSLERINFPSTLVRIGDDAFHGCESLTMLHFLEGLVDIVADAFEGCSSVKRISFPPTVTRIGDYLFCGCFSLEVAILVDGIQTIGACAFRGCVRLENLVLPATLTRIEDGAFGYCQSLRMVKLAGGIQLIEADAFERCDLLNHIRTTSKCLVVTKDGDDFDFNFASDQMIVPYTDLDQVLITSECFHSMRSEEVSALETAISEILGMHLRRRWADKHDRLRGLLAVHERRRKEEVTSILELGLWKAEMFRSGGTGPGTRAACRVICKAGVIIPNVVPFL